MQRLEMRLLLYRLAHRIGLESESESESESRDQVEESRNPHWVFSNAGSLTITCCNHKNLLTVEDVHNTTPYD